MLYFFEGGLDFHDGGEFIDDVPQVLIFSIKIVVARGLADEGMEINFYLVVNFFNFLVLFCFLVGLIFFFACLGINFLGCHIQNREQ